MSYRLFIFLGAILFIFSCKKAPNTVVAFCPQEFDSDAQILIGDAIDFYIKNDPNTFPILDNIAYAEAYTYVDKLFKSMINTKPIAPNRMKYDWHLNIIENDSLETAFFLPGGEFYVYTGLLKFLEGEHQLLNIIAHELYYVNSDWIPQTIKEQGIINCNFLGDIILSRDVPKAVDIAMAMPSLTYSETAVIEADSFAIAVLCPFLYEPLGIREIILKSNNNENSFDWLTFRSADEVMRIDEAFRIAEKCDLGGVRNEENYQRFKETMLP